MVRSVRASHDPRFSIRLCNITTDAVILPHTEWDRLKSESVHITPEEQIAAHTKREADRKHLLTNIQTKRSSLISSELSPDTIARTHSVLLTTEERDYALQLADRKSNEDIDEVKLMRSQMVSAEARTIRDGQLIEQAVRRQAERESEQEWGDRLEENRREALKFYDDRDRTVREQRMAGRAVIQTQIEEKKINSILEAERLDRESRALREQNAAIAEENRRIEEGRAQRKRAFLADCLAANKAQQKRRKEERALEKEEVQMAIEFEAQRALSDAVREKEKADQKALKEREIAEIRRKQERANDTQALRDETMAMKIQKEKEQADRAKEQADLEARKQRIIQCKVDHETMINEKRQRLIEQATIERAEFQRVMEANREAREMERRKAELKAEEDHKYRQELGQEVERVWRTKQIDPAKIERERQTLRDGNIEYLSRIERLRQEKIEILRKKGVPEKYLGEIQGNRFDLK
jgi:hypothetical protein